MHARRVALAVVALGCLAWAPYSRGEEPAAPDQATEQSLTKGRELTALGRHAEAVMVLKKAAAQSPGDVRIKQALAEAQAALVKAKVAEQAAPPAQPAQPDLTVKFALERYRAGIVALDDAVRQCQEALQRNPKAVPATVIFLKGTLEKEPNNVLVKQLLDIAEAQSARMKAENEARVKEQDARRADLLLAQMRDVEAKLQADRQARDRQAGVTATATTDWTRGRLPDPDRQQLAEGSRLHVKLPNGAELDADAAILDRFPGMADEFLMRALDRAKEGILIYPKASQTVVDLIPKVAPKAKVEKDAKTGFLLVTDDDPAELRRVEILMLASRPSGMTRSSTTATKPTTEKYSTRMAAPPEAFPPPGLVPEPAKPVTGVVTGQPLPPIQPAFFPPGAQPEPPKPIVEAAPVAPVPVAQPLPFPPGVGPMNPAAPTPGNPPAAETPVVIPLPGVTEPPPGSVGSKTPSKLPPLLVPKPVEEPGATPTEKPPEAPREREF